MLYLPRGKGSTRKAMNPSYSSGPVTEIEENMIKMRVLCSIRDTLYTNCTDTIDDDELVRKISKKMTLHIKTYKTPTSWSRDSNLQTLSPRSFISFHHLKPTKIRPLTFLTTQKSRAARRTVTTNMMTKLSMKSAERM